MGRLLVVVSDPFIPSLGHLALVFVVVVVVPSLGLLVVVGVVVVVVDAVVVSTVVEPNEKRGLFLFEVIN